LRVSHSSVNLLIVILLNAVAPSHLHWQSQIIRLCEDGDGSDGQTVRRADQVVEVVDAEENVDGLILISKLSNFFYPTLTTRKNRLERFYTEHLLKGRAQLG
jgi:hypothetical protein